MGLFNALVSRSFVPWRRANRETDYETVLAALDHDIQDVQTRLAQIRRRQRKASVTLTLQAALLWALYTGACWLFGLFTFATDATALLVWLPVLLSPVLIFCTRRIVKWWYRRIGAAEDKHLIELKRQKRDKIDELKRATKYDHLRMLLDKYDDNAPAAAVGARSANATPTSTPNKGAKRAPADSTNATPPPSAMTATPEAQAQRMAAMRQQSAATAAAAALPKTWMDKVADAVLGADSATVGPEQKYALICPKCHAHNGLALREEFSEIQYICPHCGQFNSRRPSSAPVSSPFNHTNAKVAQNVPAKEAQDTPTKVTSSKLKLRADESDNDDDDAPPKTTLQDQRGSTPVDADAPRKTRLNSLRARKSQTKRTESMDLDDN